MSATARRRILGLDRDVWFWVFVAVAMIILGIVLDVFWGSL